MFFLNSCVIGDFEVTRQWVIARKSIRSRRGPERRIGAVSVPAVRVMHLVGFGSAALGSPSF
jgi:hypothetical protein